MGKLTGSSGLLVLLIAADVVLISSIMLVSSWPISPSLFDTSSAILYLSLVLAAIADGLFVAKRTSVLSPGPGLAGSPLGQAVETSSHPRPSRTCRATEQAHLGGLRRHLIASELQPCLSQPEMFSNTISRWRCYSRQEGDPRQQPFQRVPEILSGIWIGQRPNASLSHPLICS